MDRRRIARALAASLIACCTAASTAHANTGHVFASQFGTPGGGAGQLSNPGSIALSPSGADLYVDDTNNARIARFTSAGAFVSTFDGSDAPNGNLAGSASLAVASDGDVLAAIGYPPIVERFTPGGSYAAAAKQLHGNPATIGSPGGVAVDPSNGNIFVSDTNAGTIYEYSADGAFVRSIGDGQLVAPGPLAVGSAGRLYVVGAGAALRIDAPYAGAPVAVGPTDGSSNPNSVAIDRSNDHVLITVSQGGALDYDAGGVTREASFAQFPPINTVGIAGASDGRVFLADPSGSIAVFAPADVPGAVTEAPSPLGGQTATFRARVDPSSTPTTVRFEYRQNTAADWTATSEQSVGSGDADVAVSATVGGLQPVTDSEVRVVATGANGVDVGQTVSFRTAASPPHIDGGPRTSFTDVTSAGFTTDLNPLGSATAYHYEYGTTTRYGQSTPTVSGAGDQLFFPLTAEAEVQGLRPDTSYHYRLVSSNAGGRTVSPDISFRTLPQPATVTLDAPTELTTSSARASGTIDAHGRGGSYRFVVHATDSAYAASTAATPIPAGSGPVAVSSVLSGLPAGGTFALQLVATTAAGSNGSPIVSFATPAPPASAAAVPPATGAAYGCAAPAIVPLAGPVDPGAVVQLSGSDLGVGGSVLLGSHRLTPSAYAAGGVSFRVPDDASGTLALTVDCGRLSNTVGLVVRTPPSRAFTLSSRAKGAVLTLRLTLPGAGRVTAAGSPYASRTGHPKAKGAYTIHVRLSQTARTTLAHVRSRKLKAPITVTFTPSGGKAAQRSAVVTFTRRKR